jgi:hypothetical protein
MPLRNQLHVDQLLSNVSIQYKNNEFIWSKVFPIVSVKKDSDLYRVYDRANLKSPETKRAPKAAANEGNFGFSTSSYRLEKHALVEYVGDDEAEQNDQDSLEAIATEYVTEQLEKRKELMTEALFVKANWSLNVSLASGAAFSDNTTTSNPILVFDTGAATLIANGSMAHNFGIIPHAKYLNIKNHVSVLDRVKYTSADIGEGAVASLLGIPELLVPKAVKDTAADGVAAAITPIWSNCFIGYKAPAPSNRSVSCGYSFQKPAEVRKFRDEKRKATAIEVEINFKPQVVASLTGYLIGGA